MRFAAALAAWMCAFVTSGSSVPAAAQQQPTVQYKRDLHPGNAPMVTEAAKANAWKLYNAALAKFCPAQRIALQSPAQMNLAVQGFEPQISPVQTARYRNYTGQMCELSQPTAGCSNTAMLLAAEDGGFLERFAAAECESGMRCTGAGRCAIPSK